MTRIEQATPLCARCKTEKPRSEFPIRYTGCLGSWCHDCQNEHGRNYRAKQRETSQFICENA